MPESYVAAPDLRRWVVIKRRIPKKLAQQNRLEEIRNLSSHIAALKDEIQTLRKRPLVTTVSDYVPVLPGDTRYDKAEDSFDARKFTGTWPFTTYHICPK